METLKFIAYLEWVHLAASEATMTYTQGLQSVIRTTDSADRPQSVIRGLRPADRTDWEVA